MQDTPHNKLQKHQQTHANYVHENIQTKHYLQHFHLFLGGTEFYEILNLVYVQSWRIQSKNCILKRKMRKNKNINSTIKIKNKIQEFSNLWDARNYKGQLRVCAEKIVSPSLEDSDMKSSNSGRKVALAVLLCYCNI